MSQAFQSASTATDYSTSLLILRCALLFGPGPPASLRYRRHGPLLSPANTFPTTAYLINPNWTASSSPSAPYSLSRLYRPDLHVPFVITTFAFTHRSHTLTLANNLSDPTLRSPLIPNHLLLLPSALTPNPIPLRNTHLLCLPTPRPIVLSPLSLSRLFLCPDPLLTNVHLDRARPLLHSFPLPPSIFSLSGFGSV